MSATPSMNTLLKMGAETSPFSFATIAEVRTIGGPSMSVSMQDVTTHSTSEPWRQKIATLLDAGTIPFEVNLMAEDPTHDGTTGIIGAFAARAKKTFQVVLPDGTELLQCQGYLGPKFTFGPFTVEGVQVINTEITLTGKPLIFGA